MMSCFVSRRRTRRNLLVAGALFVLALCLSPLPIAPVFWRTTLSIAFGALLSAWMRTRYPVIEVGPDDFRLWRSSFIRPTAIAWHRIRRLERHGHRLDLYLWTPKGFKRVRTRLDLTEREHWDAIENAVRERYSPLDGAAR